MILAMYASFSVFCFDAAGAVGAASLASNIIAPESVAVEGDVTEAGAASEAIDAPQGEADYKTHRADASTGPDELDAPPVLDLERARLGLVFADESDEAIANRLIDYLEGLDTLRGDFTQVSPSGAVSTGRIYLRRPGFLRFEYDAPTPLLIVANGGMVYVRDEALETTDSYPVSKTPLKFLLSKRVDYSEAEITAVDRGVDTVAVTFASSEDEAQGELTLIAKAPEMTLLRWIVRDVQNGVTVVALDEVETGVRLANRLFAPPEAGGQFLKN